MGSKIEEMILDPGFDYLQPYFYQNPFALRCELAVGKGKRESVRNARARAKKIYKLLFPHGADAIFFSYFIHDWSDSGTAWRAEHSATAAGLKQTVRVTTRALQFFFDCMLNYRHVSIKNLKTYEAPDEQDYGQIRRNRIVCYSDGIGFDDRALIKEQIRVCRTSEISLVSFDNECILSVYSDEGCDVVFATYEKMCEFYEKLRPYFLAYDLEEMEKRRKGQGTVQNQS